MPSINQKLLDDVIKFQISLRRLEAGTRRKVLETLLRMQKELIAAISAGDVSKFSRARARQLLSDITPIIANNYAEAQSILKEQIHGLVPVQIAQAEKSLELSVFIDRTVKLPTKNVIDRLSNEVLINGGPLNGWWKRQEQDTLFKLSSSIREGMLLNDTNDKIIGKVVDNLDISRRNASAIVHTAIQDVANNARQAVYEQNDDIIKSFVWFTAMDSHVCPLCIGRSGKKWKNDDGHTPIDHAIPWQVPPIHFNDRCVILPETLTFEEMGVDLQEPTIGDRASSLGPIDADSTFDDYLKRVSVKQQDEMLGKGRAKLWRDGKISLGQLLDGEGRELTLKELL